MPPTITVETQILAVLKEIRDILKDIFTQQERRG